MQIKHWGIKFLITGLLVFVALGMPNHKSDIKPMSLTPQPAARFHAATKAQPLFQQMAVFPDGSQRPLAGGVFAFYRFDTSGRRQYRLKDGRWQLVRDPLADPAVYLARADQFGNVGMTHELKNGIFYGERLHLPERYAVKLPLPVKIHVKQQRISVNGQPVRTKNSLPRIYALRVAVTRQ